jgi:hypothetical protein
MKGRRGNSSCEGTLYSSKTLEMEFLAPTRRLDQAEPGAQQVAVRSEFGGDHVGLGDEISPEEVSHGVGIDGIGLHLGGPNSLELPGMGQGEGDIDRTQDIGEPVPGAGALHEGGMRPGEGAEVALDVAPVGPDGSSLHHRAGGIQGGDDDGALVLIDAMVKHGYILREGDGARLTSSL